MRYSLILLCVSALIQLSCGKSNREAEAAKQFAQMEANGVAKVKVDERGDIYLNNKPSSLGALGDEFARIKEVNGVVWYYRTSESQPAASSGLAVVNKIIEYKLPVKMCAGNEPCRKAFE